MLISRKTYPQKQPEARSQPRIDLLRQILTTPRRPVATRLRHRRRELDLLDLLGVRDSIHIQAAGHVPSHVAVERPHAGVVGFDLHDHVRRCAVGLGVVQNVHVAALWVLWVDDAAVPFAVTFSKNVHIVAVVMETISD
jgi:hypothetical protein